MAIGRISYEDKKDYKIEGSDDSYRVTAKDMNEIKKVFNDSAETIDKTLEDTKSLQTQIDNSIKIMGTYKYQDGKVYFMKANGEWGEGISLEVSAEEFENLYLRVQYLEESGVQVADSIPIDASIIYKGERSKIPPNFELHALPFRNPNFAINPDFKIWQEGEEMTVTNGQYVADVWRVYITDASSVTIKKVPNGLQVVSLNNPGLNPSVNIYQLIEATSFLENAKCIVQQCINDVIETYSRTLNSDSLKRISLVSVNNLKTGDIANWVKLEVGDMATPFVPRSYGEELILVQRYFQVIASRKACTYQIPDYSETVVDLPIELRVSPTVSYKELVVQNLNGERIERNGNPAFSKISLNSYLLATNHAANGLYPKYIVYRLFLDARFY